LDRRTLEALPSVDVPNAHGAAMTQDGSVFYTTNIATSGGDGIYAIDTSANAMIGSAWAPHSTPHNIAVVRSGGKLYVTHSGANAQVSVYRISRRDPVPVFLRTVQTGANPFGIVSIP
jgi:DNA-binding beta-propeller fold protein YncE